MYDRYHVAEMFQAVHPDIEIGIPTRPLCDTIPCFFLLVAFLLCIIKQPSLLKKMALLHFSVKWIILVECFLQIVRFLFFCHTIMVVLGYVSQYGQMGSLNLVFSVSLQ